MYTETNTSTLVKAQEGTTYILDASFYLSPVNLLFPKSPSCGKKKTQAGLKVKKCTGHCDIKTHTHTHAIFPPLLLCLLVGKALEPAAALTMLLL